MEVSENVSLLRERIIDTGTLADRHAPVSVLMSLYWREKPDYLKEALSSIKGQTVLPDEVVMVLDGPVGDDLLKIVEDFERSNRGIMQFRLVRLEKNMGLGHALSEGLRHCSHELVARMDTDDVMMPCRIEKQAAYMTAHDDVSVCGAWIDEFVVSKDGSRNVVSTRSLPETHEALLRFARLRSPMNHPVVMFRKSRVIASGSYESFPLFEDYYLWARMLVAGEKFHNLPESLLWFRMGNDVYKRRGGLKYAMDEVRFERAIHDIGFIGTATMVKNIMIRFGVRIVPNRLRKLIYRYVLR